MDLTEGDRAQRGREHRQQAARIVLSIGLIALGLYVLQGFIRSLLWAAILAVAVGPLYERARRRFSPAGHDVLLPLLFTLGAVLIVVVPLALVLTEVGREASTSYHWLETARQEGIPVPALLDRLPWFHDQAVAWWQTNLADPAGAQELIGRFRRANPMQWGTRLGTALFHRGFEFVFMIVALFFLFREGPALGEKSLFVCRRLFGAQGEPVARQIVASIHGTVDGLVLVGLGEGAVLGVGYALAGAPHPALLGFVTAIAAIIPMGAPAVLIVAALLVVAAGKVVAAAVLFVLGMAVIFAADHAVRPVLIGGATRLPFLWVLLGILGGVESFGLLGLFLGPAVMAALILLWREWTKPATTAPIGTSRGQ